MYRYLLAIKPHGNIVAEVRRLKERCFSLFACRNDSPDHSLDEENLIIRAFPEILICGWMATSSPAQNPAIQRSLVTHAPHIFAAMPDTFRFHIGTAHVAGRYRCYLEPEHTGESGMLDHMIANLASDAGLPCVSPPDLLSFTRNLSFCLCSCGHEIPVQTISSALSDLSFRKADLVIYLVWLPDSRFEGFYLSTSACVHRKTSYKSRLSAENDPGEDL